jgi:hypothetical protein
VSGVGSSGFFLSDGSAATTRANGPMRQPKMNQPQPFRSLEFAMTMQTIPKSNHSRRNSINLSYLLTEVQFGIKRNQ